MARLWIFVGHSAAIVAGEKDVCGSEHGSNTGLIRLASSGRSVRVRGGCLMRFLVIGSQCCVVERGCAAGVAWVGTLCWG